MASSPGLMPGGGNYSGLNLSVPYAPQQGGQASLGGTVNPLLPINTSTSSAFPMFPQGAVSTSATTGFPANTGGITPGPIVPITGGTGSTTGAPGTTAGNMGMKQLSQHNQGELFKNLEKTYGAGVAQLMINFLQGGAGYNPQVLQNLIAQLQPQFNRAQQNLTQQFSAGGNRFGSGAEVGMADLLSQQNLEVGSIASQLYEQSVQNFMSVLMGAAGPDAKRIGTSSSTWDTISGILKMATPFASLIPSGGGGGGGGGILPSGSSGGGAGDF